MKNVKPQPALLYPSSVTIEGITVHQDTSGRYRLNAILEAAEKAGMSRSDGRPKEWLQTDQAQIMTAALKGENPPVEPIVIEKGRYGGSFVCRELVYAYAMWLNPVFALKVIRKFDEVQTYGIAVSERVIEADQPIDPVELLEAATEAVKRSGGLVHKEEKEARRIALKGLRRKPKW